MGVVIALYLVWMVFIFYQAIRRPGYRRREVSRMRFWFISAIHFFTIVACSVSFLVNQFNNGKTPSQFLTFRTITTYYVMLMAFWFSRLDGRTKKNLLDDVETESIHERNAIIMMFLGSASCGKNSLTRHLVDGTGPEEIGVSPTFEMDVSSTEVDREFVAMHCVIFNPNTETFSFAEDQLVDQVDCVVLVFDITNKRSFKELDLHVRRVLEASALRLVSEDARWLLIGAKSDRAPEREVSRKDAKRRARELGGSYYEVSVKAGGESVTQLFVSWCEDTTRRMSMGLSPYSSDGGESLVGRRGSGPLAQGVHLDLEQEDASMSRRRMLHNLSGDSLDAVGPLSDANLQRTPPSGSRGRSSRGSATRGGAVL